MVPIEQLGEKNLLNVYYLLAEIKEVLEIKNSTRLYIPKTRYVTNVLHYPISYASRWDAIQYLLESKNLLQASGFDDHITIVVPSQEAIFSLCAQTLANYHQRFTKPKEGAVKVDALKEEQIETLHQILHIIAIRLSMSRLPHILYIPIKQFPSEIQQSDLLGLLYKADKDFGALKFTGIIGAIPSEQEIEIKITDIAQVNSFLEFKKNVDARHSKIITTKKNIPAVPAPPKKEPLEIKIVSGSQIAIEQSEKEKGFKFPHKLPRGTKWENITIKFLDDDTVQILVQGKNETIHYRDMGLEGKGEKPGVHWMFLRVLAHRSGEIAITDPEANEKYKKQKQGLSEALQDYFRIDFDPFHPYKTTKSYKVKFVIAPPEKGFSFENKTTERERPKENNPFADIDDFMNETAPVIAQAGIIQPDDER